MVNSRWQQRALFLAAVGVLVAPAIAPAALHIVDVIPSSASTEASQDAEPSIAVNPINPNEILIHAFNGGWNGSSVPTNNPIFTSSDGGVTWPYNPAHAYTDDDGTLAWSSSGTAYFAPLVPPSGPSAAAIVARTSATPMSGNLAAKFQNIANSTYAPGSPNQFLVDQPWIAVSPVTSGNVTTDHIYISFNDFSLSTKTATVRYSNNGGTSWANTVIENTSPGVGQDSPSVRIAANGNRVYAGFQRWNSQVASGDYASDVVIVRDDTGLSGGTKFQALGGAAGSTIASGVVIPYSGAQPPFSGTSLGRERLGSNLNINVDPNNVDRVLVAFTEVLSSQPVTKLYLSGNGGSSWQQVFSVNNASLPAVAVAGNGTVGLLYESLVAGNLETHFVQSSNDFATSTDTLLSLFANNSPAAAYDPYIGDYFDLEAVGNTFYGTFCASNSPTASHWPSGVPTYLRDFALIGTSVSPSIDPFFFSVDAIPEPGAIALIAVFWPLVRRRGNGPAKEIRVGARS